ncbi:MAG: hypothetical protein AAF195_03715 [Pseudomonadota bacterium]
MKNSEFRAWLSGYFAVASDDRLNREKIFIIGNHLNLVKAVEGNLDEFNQKIFDLVDKVFQDSTEENIIAAQKQMVKWLSEYYS